MPVEPERPMTPSVTTGEACRETAPPLRAATEAILPSLPTTGAMPGVPTATEAPPTYERIFDARRLLTCLGCLKRTADHPPPLPAWFLGRHAETARTAEDLPTNVDEVVVLAAGRRPCASCHPDAALAFAEAWARGNGLRTPPSFEEIDAMLAREGISTESGDVPHWVAFVDTLPDGAVVIDATVGPEPQAIRGDAMLPWSGDGWGEPQPRSRERLVTLLTPPSTVMTLAAGYRPGWAGEGDGHQST